MPVLRDRGDSDLERTGTSEDRNDDNQNARQAHHADILSDQCAAQYGTPFPGTMTVDRNRIVKSRPFALSYGI
jgi:hypothetical protein